MLDYDLHELEMDANTLSYEAALIKRILGKFQADGKLNRIRDNNSLTYFIDNTRLKPNRVNELRATLNFNIKLNGVHVLTDLTYHDSKLIIVLGEYNA